MSLVNFIFDKVTSRKSTVQSVKDHVDHVKGKIYGLHDRKAGDIFFHYYEDSGDIGHVNMVATDTIYKVDSVTDGNSDGGVRKVLMASDRHHALVFRFIDRTVAWRAAKLVESWVNSEVGYSDRGVGGVTSRQIQLVFGTCDWGKGALGRLEKYKKRDMTPKNVTCPEMCLLSFQLNIDPSHSNFPKLDAKHSSPNTLIRYMIANPKAWSYEGIRSPRL